MPAAARAARAMGLAALLAASAFGCKPQIVASPCDRPEDCPTGFTCDSVGHYCYVPLTAPQPAVDAATVFRADAGHADVVGEDAARFDASAVDAGRADALVEDIGGFDAGAQDAGNLDATLEDGATCTSAADASAACGPTGCTPWTGNGPFGVSVSSIEVNPNNTAQVYAGTTRGVFRGDGEPLQWRPLGSPGAIRDISLNPQTGSLLASSRFGVYRSEDGAGAWEQVLEPEVEAYGGSALARDPVDLGRVYVLMMEQGVFRSVDDGQNWELVVECPGCGYPTERDNLAVDPFNSDFVALLAWQTFFFSTNRGDTWTTIEGVGSHNEIIFDPELQDVMYATRFPSGVGRSTDSGLTWEMVKDTQDSCRAIVANANAQPVELYLGCDNTGIWRSNDRFATLEPINNGLGILNAAGHIAVDPQDPDRLFAGTSGGVFMSSDRGASWEAASQGLPALGCKGLAVVPGFPRRLFTICFGAGVWRSDDSGENWDPANNGLQHYGGHSMVDNLALAPSNPNHLVFVSFTAPAYFSADGGSSWTSSGVIKNWYTVVSHPTDPLLFFGLVFNEGIWRSTDGGQNWNVTSQAAGSPRTAAAHPAAPDLVLAGTADLGVLRSTDRGLTWVPSNAGLDTMNTGGHLAFDPTDPLVVYLGTDQGVYRSIDAGLSWELRTTGLPAGGIAGLAVHPQRPQVIFASTPDDGVFASGDGGRCWRPFYAAELTHLRVNAVALSSDGSWLYAATEAGVWARQLGF